MMLQLELDRFIRQAFLTNVLSDGRVLLDRCEFGTVRASLQQIVRIALA
jgi:hypothetical protein